MKKLYALLVGCLTVTASHAQLYSLTRYNTETETRASVDKRYMGEVNFGVTFGGKYKIAGNKYDANTRSAFIETIHGVRIHKYAFVGLGLGFHGYYGLNEDASYEVEAFGSRYKYESYIDSPMAVPLFVNLKGFYPFNSRLRAYAGTSLGYAWTCDMHQSRSSYVWNNRYDYWSSENYGEYSIDGGFYGTFEVGVQWKKLNVGLGLTHQKLKPSYDNADPIQINNFSLKLGLCW